jgi:hypothetical protein
VEGGVVIALRVGQLHEPESIMPRGRGS